MASYTKNDIEDLCELIQNTLNYNDSTLKTRYNHLVYSPYYIFCDEINNEDDSWGKSYKFNARGDSMEEELLVIVKSFNDKEDQKANDFLYNDFMANGEYIGLLLMYELGTRENEACGLNYSDIREMKEYDGNYYAIIYQSTSIGSNTLKAGTKTKNGGRRIPINPQLYNFLSARKTAIEEIAGESADDYPIACKGKRFKERCSTDNLCRTGRFFFRDILKMREQDISGLAVIIENEEGFKEADPTTYLFRRNKATKLQIAELSLGESQYYMGHFITEGKAKRFDFNDETLLIKISKKLGYFK